MYTRLTFSQPDNNFQLARLVTNHNHYRNCNPLSYPLFLLYTIAEILKVVRRTQVDYVWRIKKNCLLRPPSPRHTGQLGSTPLVDQTRSYTLICLLRSPLTALSALRLRYVRGRLIIGVALCLTSIFKGRPQPQHAAQRT